MGEYKQGPIRWHIPSVVPRDEPFWLPSPSIPISGTTHVRHELLILDCDQFGVFEEKLLIMDLVQDPIHWCI